MAHGYELRNTDLIHSTAVLGHTTICHLLQYSTLPAKSSMCLVCTEHNTHGWGNGNGLIACSSSTCNIIVHMAICPHTNDCWQQSMQNSCDQSICSNSILKQQLLNMFIPKKQLQFCFTCCLHVCEIWNYFTMINKSLILSIYVKQMSVLQIAFVTAFLFITNLS